MYLIALNFKLSIRSDYVGVIKNDDVEGLTIQTIEINLTNGKVDYQKTQEYLIMTELYDKKNNQQAPYQMPTKPIKIDYQGFFKQAMHDLWEWYIINIRELDMDAYQNIDVDDVKYFREWLTNDQNFYAVDQYLPHNNTELKSIIEDCINTIDNQKLDFLSLDQIVLNLATDQIEEY